MNAPRWQYQDEREWRQYVVQVARTHGWSVYYHHDSKRTTPGWPDLALIRVPVFMLVELKSDHGKLSRAQQECIAMLQACGASVHVWRPCDEDHVRRVLRQP